MVTVALDCAGFPSGLVTELVTDVRPCAGVRRMEASLHGGFEYDPTVAEVSSLGRTHVWLTHRSNSATYPWEISAQVLSGDVWI